MSMRSYTATVLEDGHLSLSKKACKNLNLKAGDKVEVVLRKGLRPAGWLPIGTKVDRQTLEKVANFEFPDRFQKRLDELLIKKREGQITLQEEKKLDDLILQVQLANVEKSVANYLLSLKQPATNSGKTE